MYASLSIMNDPFGGWKSRLVHPQPRIDVKANDFTKFYSFPRPRSSYWCWPYLLAGTGARSEPNGVGSKDTPPWFVVRMSWEVLSLTTTVYLRRLGFFCQARFTLTRYQAISSPLFGSIHLFCPAALSRAFVYLNSTLEW